MNLKLREVRCEAARWLLALSGEMLLSALFVIVLAFVRGSQDQMIPENWWESHGNHGPWRHYRAGRELLGQSFDFLFAALGAAGLSVFIQANRRSGMALVSCLIALVVAINFVYWLVD